MNIPALFCALALVCSCYLAQTSRAGTVWGWGFNLSGEIGDGTETARPTMVPTSTAGILAGKSVVAIASTDQVALALTADNTLVSWGGGALDFYLGNGTVGQSLVPVAVDQTGVLAGKTITRIAKGGTYSMVLTSEGKVYTWGSAFWGELGNGMFRADPFDDIHSAVPVAVDTSGVLAGKTVVAISANESPLVLTADGKMYSWGPNILGTVGDGTAIDRAVPVAVDMSGEMLNKVVVKISTQLALTSDNRLYAWGYNSNGALGNGSTLSSFVPTAVDMTGALAGKTIAKISSNGNGHSLVLTTDGMVFAWGRNDKGQLGDGSTTDRYTAVAMNLAPLGGRVVQEVLAAREASYVLTTDGRMFACGSNEHGMLANGNTTDSHTLIPADQGPLGHRLVAAISKTVWGGLVITEPDPAPHLLAYDGQGAGGNPRTDNVGSFAFPAVPQNGAVTRLFTIKNEGADEMQGISLSMSGADAASFIAGSVGGTLAGGATATFAVTFHPGATGGHGATLTIASTNADNAPFRIQLTGEGTTPVPAICYGRGYNNYGETGDGTTTERGKFVRVDQSGALSGKTIAKTSSGIYHTIALGTDGRVYAWGSNQFGQLGDGTAADSSVPIAVGGLLAGKSVTDIAAGSNHCLALASDGRVYAWGGNGLGQLGIGSYASQSLPVEVDTTGVLAGKTVVAIAAGTDNSFAVTADGLAFGWGFNRSNYAGETAKLGDGTAGFFRPAPVAVDMAGALAGKFVTRISAGDNHTLALTSEGRVYAWGENTFGQLGDGTTTSRQSAVAVVVAGALAGKTVTAISAGEHHSLAATSDGWVYAWGKNEYGQLGNGTQTQSLTPVAVDRSGYLAGKSVVAVCASGAVSLAVTADGEYGGWGYFDEGQQGGGISFRLSPVRGDFTGLLQGKTVVAVDLDNNNWSILAHGATFDEADIAVESAGHELTGGGLVSYGQVAGGGSSTRTFTIKNAGNASLTGISASLTGPQSAQFDITSAPAASLAAGGASDLTVTFTPDGGGTKSAVLHIASNDPQENPFDIILTGVSGAPTGEELYGWGRNDYGQAGDGTSANRSSPVAADKSGVMWGKTITAVAGGSAFTLALDSGGGMYSWGANVYGELGNGTNAFSVAPVAVDLHRALLGETVTAIAAGGSHAAALTQSGRIFTWGKGQHGQLGQGIFDHSQTPWPVDVSGVLAGISLVRMSLGDNHSLALGNNGRVYAWGLNNSGQLGNGAGPGQEASPSAVDVSGVLAGKTVTAISAGSDYSLALTSDGKIYAWGSNYTGCLGNGSSLDSSVPVAVDMNGVLAGKTVAAISAGYGHALALTTDGRVYAWGANAGALGNGGTDPSNVPVAVATGGSFGGKLVVAIHASLFQSFALTGDGKVYAWGYNPAGLGNGLTSSTVPVLISDSGQLAGKSITDLGGGYEHTMAITGTVSPGEMAVFDGSGTTGPEREDHAGLVSFSVETASTGTTTFTIKNTGPGYLSDIEAWFDGPDAGAFSTDLQPTALPPGGSVSFEVAFNPSIAGPHSAELMIASNDADENPFRISLSGTAASPLDLWRAAYFPGSTGTTGPGADLATPQGDGISNLMKFALGMDPTKPGVLPVTFDGAGEFLSYTYTPSAAAVAAGIQFQVQFSHDMSEHSWSWEIVNQGIIGAGGAPVTATAPKPEAGGGFLRLTVTAP